MSKTRYAKFPLDCEAVKKANDAVWEKYPELKNRKLTMSPGDYKYRNVWMDAYVKAAGDKSWQYEKPKRKPGDPVTTCKAPPAQSELGDLTITVKERGTAGKPGKPIPNANYRLQGPVYRTGTVDSSGSITLEKLPKGDYRVFAWAKMHTEESETTPVIARMKWDVTVTLEREIPGNLTVRVLNRHKKPVAGAEVFIKGVYGARGQPAHEKHEKKVTPADGMVVYTSLRLGRYSAIATKDGVETDRKEAVVEKPGTGPRIELTWNPPNLWLGLGESHSGDLVVAGYYNWNGLVYKIGSYDAASVPFAKLVASGLKIGGGLGGSVGAVAVFAHGIDTVGQFKQKSTWSDMDFDLALGAKLSSALKAIKGIGKIVTTMEKYKRLSWAAQELYKNKNLRKPGVYTIPIPFAGAGLHVWIGRKYGGIDLAGSGKGLARSVGFG